MQIYGNEFARRAQLFHVSNIYYQLWIFIESPFVALRYNGINKLFGAPSTGHHLSEARVSELFGATHSKNIQDIGLHITFQCVVHLDQPTKQNGNNEILSFCLIDLISSSQLLAFDLNVPVRSLH